ncbi:hypothetical protein SY85_13545 [Flavisolibacter tropicus]|uniref:Lysozyme n=2 Tax=Flavisolibacter tropicus TaxID=1492898 RepID=A0A172TWB1_9BACT|nr:hypothetical protein SY85_13545 [Flavisolibacter tropicus]
MGLPSRTYTTTNQYRYGFNGKEQDQEVSGVGNQYDYGFRVYNPRLGRFLSVDPLFKSFAWNSPYCYAENDVIRSVDLDGKEKQIYIYDFTEDKITKTKISLPEAGPLGDGVLIQSNHGGKTTYYYGNQIPDPTIVSFKKAYEGVNTDKEGNHVGYNDHLGNPTIGFGHLIKKVEPYTVGGKISAADAEALFRKDSKDIFQKADNLLKGYTLSENQKNALYDASFNMGPGKMSHYTQDGTKYSGENFFLEYMAGGEGIKKRRYAENLLYSEGVYIHFDVINNKTTKQTAKDAVNGQTGGPDPISSQGTAGKIPDEKNR